MKKDTDPIDQFFRDALQDHTVTPSESAKAAFLKEAETIVAKKPSSGKKGFIFLAIGIIALITGISLYLGFHWMKERQIVRTENRADVSASAVTRNVNRTANTPNPNVLPVENQKNTGSATKFIEKETKSTARAFARKNTTPDITSHVAINSSENKISTLPEVQETTKTLFNAQPTPSSPGIIEKQTAKPEIDTQKSSGQQLSVTETMKKETVQPDETVKIKGETGNQQVVNPGSTATASQPTPHKQHLSTPSDQHFRIGIYYSPEWMFNTLEGEKYVNNAGIEGTFHFGKYSVRTGAGISLTEGFHEVTTAYNDYLGQYKELDSITFAWDANHYYLLPTYYTSNKEVYDSLMKLENSRIKKRYTYLQIPLILGYDFWTTERFSLGVRTGPVFSLLLSTQQISGEFEAGRNRIVRINDITPDRIQTNWQIMAGIDFNLMLTKKLSLELEPDFRYYFNSVYEKSGDAKKPFSTGLRAAFLFNF